ncbi:MULTISPECIES: hypothetical protein [unclassified Acidovorax]|uniref:hypothetical protein n=1 Tax=unclassified Acidovorax TaxID=2684926 RepID=UPI002883232D|nr:MULTISPECIES: hypothetical protein [unclassified Acidovorax]
MPNLPSVLRLATATVVASLAVGCAAVPGDPYYDQGGSYYPSNGYPVSSYPSTSSSVTVYEQSPRYIYSSPQVVPVPVPIYTQRPGWQRGDDDWRERRDRQAWEARRRDDERRDASRREADRREADRRWDDRRRGEEIRRDADRRDAERQRDERVQRNANRLPPHPNPEIERNRRDEAERNRRTWEQMENNRRRGEGNQKPDWR